MTPLVPRLDVLPLAQRTLWPRLCFALDRFTLYGGTALALRLGHRTSADFDFFAFTSFDPARLQREEPMLAAAEVLQLEPNTLTVLVHADGMPVRVSFFGNLTFQRIHEPDLTADGVCRIASLPDLFATKLNTIYQRVEAKDYLDIHAILQAGLTLRQGVEFTRQVYGPNFNAMLPLQALCYFEEPELHSLPQSIRQVLTAAVQSVH
jgi:hypothetical protein